MGRAAPSALAPAGRSGAAGRSAARFSEPKASVVGSLVAGVRSLGGSAAELGGLRRGAEGKCRKSGTHANAGRAALQALCEEVALVVGCLAAALISQCLNSTGAHWHAAVGAMFKQHLQRTGPACACSETRSPAYTWGN